MKLKKGFTIAEVLVAIGITGIIAALMVTTFNNVKPDRDKLMYIKAYDALNEAVAAMVSNQSIYKGVYTATLIKQNKKIIFNVSKYPLLDLAKPTDSGKYGTVGGEIKFANVLREMLNGETVSGCGSSSSKCEFTTNSKTTIWLVEPIYTKKLSEVTGDSSEILYYNDISLGVNGNTPKDVAFRVCADGEIRFANKDVAKYVKYRKNLRSKNDGNADNLVNLTPISPITAKDLDWVEQVSDNNSSHQNSGLKKPKTNASGR